MNRAFVGELAKAYATQEALKSKWFIGGTIWDFYLDGTRGRTAAYRINQGAWRYANKSK